MSLPSDLYSDKHSHGSDDQSVFEQSSNKGKKRYKSVEDNFGNKDHRELTGSKAFLASSNESLGNLQPMSTLGRKRNLFLVYYQVPS